MRTHCGILLLSEVGRTDQTTRTQEAKIFAMTHRIGGGGSAIWAVGLSAWVVCGLAGCKPGGASPSPATKPVAPAKAEGAPKQAELAAIKSTPAPEKRRGPALAPGCR